MKKILFLFILFPLLCSGQLDSIQDLKTNYKYVIVELKDKSSQEIYKKIKSWALRYYENPKFVIKSEEENSYIRISASSKYTYRQFGINNNTYHYDLELEIRDGKYKIEFFNVIDPALLNGKYPSFLYDKDGNPKGFKKVNASLQKGMLNSLNKIHFDLYNYIINDKDDW